MARFLTAAWIDAFDTVAREAPGLRLPTGEPPLVIQHLVTDLPDDLDVSDASFRLVLSDRPARVRRGGGDDATITFTETYATAAAIASGQASAQAAFMAGELRVGGQVDRLLANHGVMTGVDDVFATLRAETEY